MRVFCRSFIFHFAKVRFHRDARPFPLIFTIFRLGRRFVDYARSSQTDLAVIFRPGLINHPSHEMSPKEHQLSQEVLEFLIEHQDWFMLDVPPPPPPNKPANDMSGAGAGRPGQSRPRSVSPHPTVRSSLAEPGWRLVEKPGELREREPSPTGAAGPGGRPGSPRTGRGGRRRSSSASGDVIPPLSSGSHVPGGSGTSNAHVRIASAGNTSHASPGASASGSGSGTGSPVYPGASAVAVTRSRTMPARSRTGASHGSGSHSGLSGHSGSGQTSRDDTSGTRRDAARADAAATAAGRNVLKKQKRASVQPTSLSSGMLGTTGLGPGPPLGAGAGS